MLVLERGGPKNNMCVGPGIGFDNKVKHGLKRRRHSPEPRNPVGTRWMLFLSRSLSSNVALDRLTRVFISVSSKTGAAGSCVGWRQLSSAQSMPIDEYEFGSLSKRRDMSH
jgi:hypothetical protein